MCSAVTERLQGTGWWRLVWLSSLLLSRAAQREEKVVKTLIVAIKGYWLSFPPCLGDKVSISWSHTELLTACFLSGRPVPLGCPLQRSHACTCMTYMRIHTTHSCLLFQSQRSAILSLSCHQIIHFTARDQTLSPLAVCYGDYCKPCMWAHTRAHMHYINFRDTVVSCHKAS